MKHSRLKALTFKGTSLLVFCLFTIFSFSTIVWCAQSEQGISVCSVGTHCTDSDEGGCGFAIEASAQECGGCCPATPVCPLPGIPDRDCCHAMPLDLHAAVVAQLSLLESDSSTMLPPQVLVIADQQVERAEFIEDSNRSLSSNLPATDPVRGPPISFS